MNQQLKQRKSKFWVVSAKMRAKSGCSSTSWTVLLVASPTASKFSWAQLFATSSNIPWPDHRRLSLSTNMIEKMFPLTGMNNLKILSLARNRLKRLEKLEDVAETLEQLWVSYNEISSLDGLQGLNKLQVLYISNNSIKDWSELDKLVSDRHISQHIFCVFGLLKCTTSHHRLSWSHCARCCLWATTFTTAWTLKWHV